MPLSGFVDDTRAVLSVTGADARDLLQDLVTNDLEKLAPGALVYAALLTPQGKYLFDFFVGVEGDALFIDVAAAQAPALAQRLNMYKLRRDMAIEATETPIALVWGDGDAPLGARPDPRDASLGWRIYGDPPAMEAAGRSDYDALRIAACAPETGVELIPNDTFILEAGFERLNGVDFRKGCYVGQEVTARMKHKTELKKGLARVAVEGAAEPGTPLETAEGKPAGTLFTTVCGEGLAHLRFDRAEGAMSAGDATVTRAA
ncbi:MAG: folate-binding protein [Pseudomonadota bacterium]